VELRVVRTVPQELVDPLWHLHELAFDELRTQAAQAHQLDRHGFEAVLDDKRVAKYLVLDDAAGGRPCGISTLTNDLDAVPLISPEYYQQRWPEYYRKQLIWYVGFLAVHPDYQRSGAVAQLISAMCEAAAGTGGIVAADICEFNEATLRLPIAIARLARNYAPGVTPQRLDAQVYWAFEFPQPA
jgi:ribosomal protein S18 acetylase RimI-like enzyme